MNKQNQNEEELLEEINIVRSWEKEWKQNLPKYRGKELLDIFPEAREIIPIKIKEWKECLEGEKNRIRDALSAVYKIKTDKFSEWFGEEVIKVFMLPKVEKCKKRIFRLEIIMGLFKKSKSKGISMDDRIQQAREYPIFDIAKFRLDFQSHGNKASSLCPYHNEKHPSFYIYYEKNTFHCYGCQAHGDVIALTMHLYSVDFKEAVNLLTK